MIRYSWKCKDDGKTFLFEHQLFEHKKDNPEHTIVRDLGVVVE